MTLFSSKTPLATLVLLDIALSSDMPVKSRAIRERLKLPNRRIEPMMQALVRARLLRGLRGPGGGYCLAKAAEEITLLDIDHVMGEDEAVASIVGRTPRSELGRKIVKPVLVRLERSWNEAEKRITLGQLMGRINAA